MIEDRISRRRLLQQALAGIAAVPAAALVAREALAAKEPEVAESDPTAQSLNYVHDASKVNTKKNPTYKPGQHCANCIQYTGKAGEASGGCNIFPGKSVRAAGWCKVWVLKPGAKI